MKKVLFVSLMLLALAGMSFGIYNPTRFPNGLETNIISPDSTAKTNRGTLQINATTLNVKVLSFNIQTLYSSNLSLTGTITANKFVGSVASLTGDLKAVGVSANNVIASTINATTGLTIGRAWGSTDETLDVMGNIDVESAPGVDTVVINGSNGNISTNGTLVINGTLTGVTQLVTTLNSTLVINHASNGGTGLSVGNGGYVYNFTRSSNDGGLRIQGTQGGGADNIVLAPTNGKVGVGITPSVALEVNGTISANEIGTAWTSFTPSWNLASGASPTFNTGAVVTGRYKRIGKTVLANYFLDSSSQSGSGASAFQMYYPSPFTATAINNTTIGTGMFKGTATLAPCIAQDVNNTNYFQLNKGGSFVTNGDFTGACDLMLMIEFQTP